ncbi:MAG TPA: UDP-N-acetylmuramoyl-L-alanine--D-glutamate ligase [Burkholderiaceae bacterium]|nr:UDP-N-acetylmuramoyl-L-alanine--D-glutamate ligase [Burkholderiaceae bacterium]
MDLHAHPLHNQAVLVLGHGISGLAMARWCQRLGARVTLADTREQPERMAQLREWLPGVDVVAGAFDAALVQRQAWALIGKSPGLSPAQLAAVQAAADECGVPVLGELALWADGLRLAYAQAGFVPKVLAITGTNGKTTTTSLTGQLLQRAGWRVAVAGNIGPALLDVLGEAMDVEEKSALALSEKAQEATESIAIAAADADAAPTEAPASTLPQVWVLELSSFQLDGVPLGAQGFEPTAATVLNLTQDHLDWHGSMDAYAAAKQRVYGAAGVRVLNRDDAAVMAARPADAAVLWTSFGTDLPTRPGDWGLETVNGMTWLVRAQPSDETRVTTRRRKAAEPEDVVLQRLMPAEALRIRGRHNASNALAALALATTAGATLAPMLHGLREYRGEPHRVESVGVIGGVEYFDDSKGTNVGATLAAILGLGVERRLVLILGGDGKGQDFSPLADAVRRHVQAVVLIGRDAPLLREVLAPTGVPLFDAPDMSQAVRLAAAQALEGQAVVMSPACASLDMFKNYAHRAQVFCDTVAELATEQGVTGVGA